MIQALRKYAITNKKSGNALDVSGADNTSIIGYPYDGRDSQKWTLLDRIMDAWLDRPEFTVWSILQARGKTGCCFTIEGEPRDGVKMVRIPSIMYFEIVPVEGHEPDHYRIFFPLSNLFVTLSGDDSSTPVELRRETGGDDQIWKFQQV